MIRAVMTERVKLRHEMTELTIGMNEVVNAGGQHIISPAGGPRRCCAAARRYGRRQVWRARSILPQFETCEERLPVIIHRPGIFLILLVKAVDVVGVGPVHEIEGVHLS